MKLLDRIRQSLLDIKNRSNNLYQALLLEINKYPPPSIPSSPASSPVVPSPSLSSQNTRAWWIAASVCKIYHFDERFMPGASLQNRIPPNQPPFLPRNAATLPANPLNIIGKSRNGCWCGECGWWWRRIHICHIPNQRLQIQLPQPQSLPQSHATQSTPLGTPVCVAFIWVLD